MRVVRDSRGISGLTYFAGPYLDYVYGRALQWIPLGSTYFSSGQCLGRWHPRRLALWVQGLWREGPRVKGRWSSLR